MTQPTILVENLSKRYRIGLAEQREETLVGAITSYVRQPLKNLRRLSRLTSFRKEENGADVIWAIKGVSFSVAEGEVVGIIGRNGAGKSTLLKILSRITTPTLGEARIYGQVSSLLEVGTGFHQDLTGRENIYLNGTILGMKKSEIDRKFEEIVEFSGVSQYLDTPVKRYSSGMKVRLAFSVAAHLDPKVLMIDEVLAVGDAEFQRKCLGKMENVAQSGRTILFVSHNMAAVRALCSRTIYLDHGEVLQIGHTSEVITNYLASSDQIGEMRQRVGYNPNSPIFIEQVQLQMVGQNEKGQTQVEVLLTCYANQQTPFTVEWILSSSFGQALAYGSPQRFRKEPLPPQKKGRFKIRFRVSEMPLAVGRYYFDFRLGNHQQRTYYDSFERATSFDVELFDPYQKGRSYQGKWGPFHFPDEFVVEL